MPESGLPYNLTMGHRLSRITTRTGDKGTTGLGDGTRVSKATARVQAMGDVDELNSLIGLLLCEDLAREMQNLLRKVQHTLFDLGAELSLPGSEVISAARVRAMESAIDHYNAALPPLKEFILPGGSRTAAVCHLARSVCRRAERTVISVGAAETINPQAVIFLNRLSDLLFVLARTLARQEGAVEVLWERNRTS